MCEVCRVCALEATSVALSLRLTEVVACVRAQRLTGEMCLSTENIRNALLARQTQEKERIPRDKRSFHGRDYREPQHALAVSQSIK